jgi:hypothetical protein
MRAKVGYVDSSWQFFLWPNGLRLSMEGLIVECEANVPRIGFERFVRFGLPR